MKSKGRSSLRRKPATRRAKKYFFLFCEGKNTERDYFSALAQTVDTSKLKVIYSGALGVPKTVASKAIKYARDNGLARTQSRRKINSFEANDEVWAIFDRDEFPSYAEARMMCEGAGIGCAYSDPCFEHWLNLHFGTYDAPCSRHEAQKICKTLIPGYDPDNGKTADFSAVVKDVATAEENSRQQRERRTSENNIDGNPSTNMHLLTLKMRSQ